MHRNVEFAQEFRNITDAVVALDRQWRFTYLNNKAHRLLAGHNRIMPGDSIWSVNTDWLGPNFYRRLQKAVQINDIIEFERFNPTEEKWFEIRCFPNPNGLLMLLRDISECRQKNEEFERIKSKKADIIHGLPDGFLIVDEEFQVTIINEKARNYLELNAEVFQGERLADILPCDNKIDSRLTMVRLHKDPVQFEIASLSSAKYLRFYAYPVGNQEIAIHVRDITEEKRVERELIRLDQLHLVGQVAAGLSHEIRNPMTTVRGYLQCLANKEAFQDYTQQIGTMIEELDRVSGIITEFLSMAKTGSTRFEKKNLNDVLNHIYPLIQAEALLSSKEVALNLSELPDINIDEKEVRQVIFTLVKNALDASSAGQRVTIDTKTIGGAPLLSITDQGPGIPGEVLSKIGTPFFTTKENGTGLGIAISQAILKKHDAKLVIKTGNSGTTFSILFQE